MKKAALAAMVCVILAGCAAQENCLETGMELRAKLLKAEQVCFRADICADHGDTLDLFSVECSTDEEGNVAFTVTSPESIRGITGKLSAEKGKLTFEDSALYFPLLAQGRLSPVSAPWVLMKTLRSGYLRAAGREETGIRLTFDDSYEENALQLDVWLNEEDLPDRAEVLSEGRLIVSMEIADVRIL